MLIKGAIGEVSGWIKQKKIVAICCLTVFCGCSRTSTTSYYVLRPIDQQEVTLPVATAKFHLAVQPVVVPGYLEGQRIIGVSPSNRLTLISDTEWAEPLKDNISRLMVENLVRYLGESRAGSALTSPASGNTHFLNIQILSFEAVSPEEVVLEARWQVSRVNPVLELVNKYSKISEPIGASAESSETHSRKIQLRVGPTVEAMNRAFSRLSEEIANYCLSL